VPLLRAANARVERLAYAPWSTLEDPLEGLQLTRDVMADSQTHERVEHTWRGQFCSATLGHPCGLAEVIEHVSHVQYVGAVVLTPVDSIRRLPAEANVVHVSPGENRHRPVHDVVTGAWAWPATTRVRDREHLWAPLRIVSWIRHIGEDVINRPADLHTACDLHAMPIMSVRIAQAKIQLRSDL